MMSPIPSPINIKPLISLPKHYCIMSARPKIRCGQNGNLATCTSCLAGKPKCAASGIENEKINQIELPGGLDPELMPKHVAIFFDGNRRWAKSKGLSPIDGYEAGAENIKKLAFFFDKCGVEILSLHAFSKDCWNRPREEVEFLMKLGEQMIQKDIEELIQNDVRVTILGDISRLPQRLVDLAHLSEESIKKNKGPHLVVSVDYSGRYDITEATRRIARKVKDGVLRVEDIDETLFEQHLDTNGLDFPNPDLLIRTGAKSKVSNFMLWQLAYTELYFSDKMFPDFNEEDSVQALAEYQRRHRRFGAQ